MDLTLHVVSMLDVGRSASVISANERERLIALTAVDVGMTRPLLSAAIILRRNGLAVREQRRAFPQHARMFERIRALSYDLDQRFLGRWETGHPTAQETFGIRRPSASGSALRAVRQAISELGFEASRQALLARADAIWKSSRGVKT